MAELMTLLHTVRLNGLESNVSVISRQQKQNWHITLPS